MRSNARRLGAALLALIFGAVGVATLIRYVQTAEDRALAGQQLVDVIVVTEAVDAGTTVDDVALVVETKQVPVSSQTPGALADLSTVEGQVTTVDLVPGEQLLAARFEERYARTVAGGDLTIPPGLVEVTIKLPPERVVGAQLTPGEKVAVLATFQQIGTVDGVEDSGAEVAEGSPVTGVLLRQALVTNIQAATAAQVADSEVDRSRQVAENLNLFLTLALEPALTERLIFATEQGSLWVARESAGEAVESGPLVSYETVFDGALAQALEDARARASAASTLAESEDEVVAELEATENTGSEEDN